jgi:hypothetical protein
MCASTGAKSGNIDPLAIECVGRFIFALCTVEPALHNALVMEILETSAR